MAKPVKFDIPAQPAGDALITFSKQSGMDVLYAYKDLQAVRSPAVTGEMEPDAALALLLKNTGFTATRDSGKFVVTKAKVVAATGSVRGTLALPSGSPAADVLVVIRETSQSAETDKFGQFFFKAVAPGSYVIVARAEGYQPLHITEVVVKANSELALSKETLHKPADGVTVLEPFVVHAEAVTQLEKFEVTASKQKPFEGINVDVPRTVDDVQPYVIFDAKTIDSSGAANVEDFLKQRLTMNTAALTNGQSATSTSGNTSAINLRGVGTDKTLILVNGRRMAGVTIQNNDNQPDLNGIPLSAIDRIEVLPSSASGIYGGSAIGGVVNVILKRDYAGGEIRAGYANTFQTDSPTRNVSASYGMALEGGKTHVMLSASWSDAKPLVLEDRVGIYQDNRATILRNLPTFIYSSLSIPIGNTTNISSPSGSNLIFKNGNVPLNAAITYVPAGTTPTTSAATLAAGLIANAGKYDLSLPPTTQTPDGLLRPFGSTPKNNSFQASIRRQMLPQLELFADLGYFKNQTTSVFNAFANTITVAAASPVNPFTVNVQVRVPDAGQNAIITKSENRTGTLGAVAQLPFGWTGELDYTWSENRYQYHQFNVDLTAIGNDVNSGVLNPFVDTFLFPLVGTKYLVPNNYENANRLQDFSLRGSGPLPALPWGMPSLTIGLEHRLAQVPARTLESDYPITIGSSSIINYYARDSVTDSGYAEALVPLIKTDWLRGVHALELQLAGRTERYTVDTGTASQQTLFQRTPPVISYSGPTNAGQPFFTKTSYRSSNFTAGFKYQPVKELTLRFSSATAFLPPLPSQLVANPAVDAFKPTVFDPTKGANVVITTQSGGNPNLKPQNSKSLNGGIIWEPTWKPLAGLRLDAEYYKIDQFDAISTLTAQTIVTNESLFPGRVTRDATGAITLVDVSLINLYKLETEGWDLSADYSVKTGLGRFNLHAVESILLHLKTQFSPLLPQYDAAGFSPGDSGGAPKHKSNATLTWEWRKLTAGWTTRYFGSYKQFGAAGGPTSLQNTNGLPDTRAADYLGAQGSDTVSSQMYHDLFLGYDFGRTARESSNWAAMNLGNKVLDGVSVQFGVRNIFDKAPPLDVFYGQIYYTSPYGDMRLRSYWITVKKTF